MWAQAYDKRPLRSLIFLLIFHLFLYIIDEYTYMCIIKHYFACHFSCCTTKYLIELNNEVTDESNSRQQQEIKKHWQTICFGNHLRMTTYFFHWLPRSGPEGGTRKTVWVQEQNKHFLVVISVFYKLHDLEGSTWLFWASNSSYRNYTIPQWHL